MRKTDLNKLIARYPHSGSTPEKTRHLFRLALIDRGFKSLMDSDPNLFMAWADIGTYFVARLLADFRRNYGIEGRFLKKDFDRICNTAGIMVFVDDLPKHRLIRPTAIGFFTHPVGRIPPAIFIKKGLGRSLTRTVMAHEISHYWLHSLHWPDRGSEAVMAHQRADYLDSQLQMHTEMEADVMASYLLTGETPVLKEGLRWKSNKSRLRCLTQLSEVEVKNAKV